MAFFIKWYLLYTSGFIALAILGDWFDGVPFDTKPRLEPVQNPCVSCLLMQIGCRSRRKMQAIARLLPNFVTQPCSQDALAAAAQGF